MESPDKVRKANTIVLLLRITGVLFFIASGLNILTWKYAVFAGIACFLLAPAVRQLVIMR